MKKEQWVSVLVFRHKETLFQASDTVRSPVLFSQRQQVVLTQHWAKANKVIHFSVMHPGWVDTPGMDASTK